jgi:hypothetical protein
MKSQTALVVLLTVLAFCPLLLAQQATGSTTRELNNDAVIKLINAGLSDDLIISTINALPGAYDTSPDGLIGLKTARASDKVVSAIVLKTSSISAVRPPVSPVAPVVEGAAPTPSIQSPEAQNDQEPAQKSFAASQTGQLVSSAVRVPPSAVSAPRVFLQSASKGRNRNAARDQSMEMSKDLEKDCPAVRVTINQPAADYTVLLNHIESGFVRDNQIQVANKDGDLLSRTKEGGSIAGGMKKACALILEDWAKR